MFQKIINTFLSKIVILLANFGILWITAKLLLPVTEVRGEVSLLVLDVTLILTVCFLVGGSTVVYLAPRHHTKDILFPSYLWSILVSILGGLFLYLTGRYSIELTLLISFITLFHSVFYTHSNILLGKNKIKLHNLLQVVQITLLLVILLLNIFVFGRTDLMAYISSLLGSLILTVLLSIPLVLRNLTVATKERFKVIFGKMFRYGLFIQVAAIFHLMNNRFCYYVLEDQFENSKGIIGILSVGIALVEAVWVFSKSLSMVLYGRVSNEKDSKKAQGITMFFAKLSFITTFLIAIILTSLPEKFYLFIFGEEYQGIADILLFLSPTILFYSLLTILSHYFSGIGKYHFNTISSGLGFITTVIFALWLIPSYGIKGSTLAMAVAYLISLATAFIQMQRVKEISWKNLLPSFHDIAMAKQAFGKLFREH